MRERRLSERFLSPIAEFLHIESAGGLVLMAAAIIALIVANSPLAEGYQNFLHAKLTVALSKDALVKDVHFWVNDGLMAIFFFLVGLEIKRELLVGELSNRKAAALPFAAALGGMLIPAGIYALLNANGPGVKGWGIPMATDIAFSLGILALLGPRVPLALKVFLAALAIVDDLGAVLVIAVFYTHGFSAPDLMVALGIVAFLGFLNWFGIRSPLLYLVLGIPLWVFVYRSGVHATVAGVLLALTIPAKVKLGGNRFVEEVEQALGEFRAGDTSPEAKRVLTSAQTAAVTDIERSCQQVQMPLERVENVLHPWVTFAIVPIFAFVNAGLAVSGDSFAKLGDPVALGIVLGLVLGKPLGIVGMAWLAVRMGWAALPRGVCWRQVVGVGFLGGVGFTMSLFIAQLGFESEAQLNVAKFGILFASLVAGLAGYLILRRSPRAVRSQV